MGYRVLVGAVAAMAALPLMAGAAGAETAATSEKPLWRQSHDYWTTQAAPRVEQPVQDARVGGPAGEDALRAQHDTGFPPAAQELARREALASATEQTPMSLARKAGAKPVQRARLLTLLAEFDPNANDDFSGWERPDPRDRRVLDRAGRHAVQRPGPQPTARPGHERAGQRQQHVLGAGLQPSRTTTRSSTSKDGLTKKVRADLAAGSTCAAAPCATTTSRCRRAPTRSRGNGHARG